jgi:hypothetical protein
MSVSRKGKRPISVDGRQYLWWVSQDWEPPYVPSAGTSLTIVDTSGEFGVEYHLGQPSDVRHLVVTGSRFRVSGCGGRHRRFLCPIVVDGPAVTPSTVAELIRWAMDRGEDPVEVNYLGLPLSQPAG